jgi:hypothetical protein
MKNCIAVATIALGLSACGTTNSYFSTKTSNVEYYRIFDIKTGASRSQVIKAASNGLGRNVSDANEAIPIPGSAEPPPSPGRFKLSRPFEGSNLALLAGGAGRISLQIASCDGSIWNAKAQRNVRNSNSVELTACLFQYKGGYHLDLYAVLTKQEGGILQISRDVAFSVVGTPEQWTEKTMLDIARSIHFANAAEVTLLEAQPELAGTPWLDPLDTFPGR